MRKRVFVIAGVLCALVGCQTSAQRENERIVGVAQEGQAATEACRDRVLSSPEYLALKAKLPPYDPKDMPTLQQQADTSRATPDQARMLYTLHADYIAPCRKPQIEAADKISPALVTVLAEGYAKSDALFLDVAERKITWGEFNRGYLSLRNESRTRLQQVGQSIKQNLQNSHASEIQQRQAAAAAFSQWSYQQQVLNQQQQMINAANRPRMTNCSYVGTMLNCTSY